MRNYVNAVRSLEAYKAGDYTIPALKELDTSKVTTATKQEDFVNPFGDEAPKANSAPTDSNPWGDDDDNPFA